MMTSDNKVRVTEGDNGHGEAGGEEHKVHTPQLEAQELWTGSSREKEMMQMNVGINSRWGD